MTGQVIQVAIGLIVYQHQILVGWRDEKLHQGGCYEFPGGKVEATENSQQAVIREIKEEVGIDVGIIKLFHHLDFDYPDRKIHLDFYLCKPIDLQPQFDNHWQWVAIDQLEILKFPAANAVILHRLNWSRYLAITPEWHILQQKQRKPEIDLCYLRIDLQDHQQYLQTINDAIKLIVKWDIYQDLDQESQDKIFAVHLNAKQLYLFDNLDHLLNKNVIAACHCEADIIQANHLGCDAILLSPVQATHTHPHQNPLGWKMFEELAKKAYMPVYALGGMQLQQLKLAQQYAAYGIAGIGDFWTDGSIQI